MPNECSLNVCNSFFRLELDLYGKTINYYWRFFSLLQVKTGSIYSCQWGNARQVDDAMVLASGTELEMRGRLQQEQRPAGPKPKRRKVNE